MGEFASKRRAREAQYLQRKREQQAAARVAKKLRGPNRFEEVYCFSTIAADEVYAISLNLQRRFYALLNADLLEL